MIKDSDWENISMGSFCGWIETSEWRLKDPESFNFAELIHFILSNHETAQVYAFKPDCPVHLCSFKDSMLTYSSVACKDIHGGCTLYKVSRSSENNSLIPRQYTYVVTFPYSISEKL